MQTTSTNGQRTHASACCCPVCRGLTCFEAPKYSTGALLSAEDLSSEQAYVRAKSRLQNRFLHGNGTVCGLKVICDDCEGSVRVLPGYALDPCGNDLVLAEATRFDIAKAIRDCCNAKRPKLGDCDPFVAPPDPGCRDVESHWCVTLRFREVESGHTVALSKQPVPSGGCGCGGGRDCGCGGSGHGCGCGGGTSQSSAGCGCGGQSANARSYAPLGGTSPSPALGYTTPGCTPRRIVECVEIGIMPHDGPCQPQWRRDPVGSTNVPTGGGLFADLIKPDSLLGRIIACFTDMAAYLADRVQGADLAPLEYVVGTNPPPANLTPQQVRDALCRARAAVLDLVRTKDPVRCQMLRTFAAITVPQIQGDEIAADYIIRARPVLENIFTVLFQTVMDCICGAFLPPCSEDPCDDRVPIACVTMRGDQVIDICNHSCRTYAGAFPSLYYWQSLVPVVPLIQRLLAILCCAPDALTRNSPLVNHLMPLIQSLDPNDDWRNAVAQDEFALVRTVNRILPELSLGRIFAEAAPKVQPVSTAGVIGAETDTAVATLKTRGIHAEILEIVDPKRAGIRLSTLGAVVADKGETLTLAVHNGKVIGIARGTGKVQPKPGTEARFDEEPGTNDIALLRAEMDALRAEVAELRRARGSGTSATKRGKKT